MEAGARKDACREEWAAGPRSYILDTFANLLEFQRFSEVFSFRFLNFESRERALIFVYLFLSCIIFSNTNCSIKLPRAPVGKHNCYGKEIVLIVPDDARTLWGVKKCAPTLFFYVLAMHLLVFVTTHHWSLVTLVHLRQFPFSRSAVTRNC